MGGGKGLEGGPARGLPLAGRELAGQVLKRARIGHLTSRVRHCKFSKNRWNQVSRFVVQFK